MLCRLKTHSSAQGTLPPAQRLAGSAQEVDVEEGRKGISGAYVYVDTESEIETQNVT